ncbi:tyrosine/serine phosphatase [Agrilactobacillus composti DSM 18527 = JCM 14202]|nr:tyrosine-protein phosphatase [Agrilactobacillus composti]GAF41054.1 tyrosine/serine phosphatase [Agrilactobacillus composti DSM 18527 = JCM 14202]
MEKITNLRSMGGYQNDQGQTVKAGLLYRSGQLFELTAKQQQYLANDLGIKRIVDMRSADERADYSDTLWPGVTYVVQDILKDATTNNASLGQMITEKGNVHENMLATYTQLALSDSAQKGYHQFLQDLLQVAEPTIFHCFAGKDRTGVAAALILKLLGVSDQDILADYLQTNAARKTANAQILADLKQQGFADQQLKAIGTALMVDGDYLTHYFQVINTKFGSFANYVQQGLKLSEAEVARFRQLYLD